MSICETRRRCASKVLGTAVGILLALSMPNCESSQAPEPSPTRSRPPAIEPTPTADQGLPTIIETTLPFPK